MAPNGRKDARPSGKSDPPSSSAPQPAELTPSPQWSQGIATSSNHQQGGQAASGLESSPKVSAASEGLSEPQRGAPDGRSATHDTSCTRGEGDCSCGGEGLGRTGGEGGEDQGRRDEKEPGDERGLR